MQDRAAGATVIAIVGAVGQGKSWLAQRIVLGTDAERSIRSGNAEDDSTKRLTWIGPQPPGDLDQRRERYLFCAATSMADFGGSYLLVDTPGATDSDQDIAETARRALAMAAVLIMVVRRDQLRSQAVSVLTTLGEGTIVVPVINAVRDSTDPELAADADALLSRMRAAAPSGTILAPVLIPDFDVQSVDEATAATAALAQIGRSLSPYLDGHLSDDRRRRIRLEALDERFRDSLRATLGDHLPGLTRAVDRLNEEAQQLPRDIALSLVGGRESLRAGIRSRLRLALLTNTPAIWFPYRTMLGLLNLTHGAWDRVVLSLAGSLPSLLTAAWTSARNLGRGGNIDRDLREGLRQRSNAAVVDRLGPPIARFHDQLKELTSGGVIPAAAIAGEVDDRTPQFASLAGVDTLQETSQTIFDEEIDAATMRGPFVMLAAIIGTMLFWFLMAGPIVSLYRDYILASFHVLRDGGGSLDEFPRPEAAMLLTSMLLSLLPTALFAMLVMTWAQRGGRVYAAEKAIRQRHDEAIRQLQSEGVLRLRWNDPQLADAEFLLTAGRSS